MLFKEQHNKLMEDSTSDPFAPWLSQMPSRFVTSKAITRASKKDIWLLLAQSEDFNAYWGAERNFIRRKKYGNTWQDLVLKVNLYSVDLDNYTTISLRCYKTVDDAYAPGSPDFTLPSLGYSISLNHKDLVATINSIAYYFHSEHFAICYKANLEKKAGLYEGCASCVNQLTCLAKTP